LHFRPLSLASAALALVIAAATLASAQSPAKPCDAKSAKVADPGRVAADPDAFAGKCVRLRGVWRDIGFYPTAAEAAQPDALSIATLDQRRIGLYLSDRDLARAPQGPITATVVGVVGNCAGEKPAGVDAQADYCRYKQGAYLVVALIDAGK